MTLESPIHRRFPKVWLLSTVVVTASAYLAWPYMSLWQFYSALRSQNAEAISNHIDFPSLRTSVKDQVNALVMAGTVANGQAENGMFAGIAAAVLPTIVESMVDAYVTPAGVTQLFQSDTFNLANQALEGSSSAEDSPSSVTPSDPLTSIKFAFFANPGRFLLKTEGMDFVFRLRDWGWKLTEVKLTQSGLESMEAGLESMGGQQDSLETSAIADQQATDSPRPQLETANAVTEEEALSVIEELYHLLSTKQFEAASALYSPQLADSFAPSFFNRFERVTVADLSLTSRTESSLSFLGQNTYVYPDGSIQTERRSYTVRRLQGELKLTSSEFVEVTQARSSG